MTEELTIGGRIKIWRESLRLTQDDAATRLGIPFGTYQKYEMGMRALGAKAVGCFINAGVNPVWLINGDGEMLLSDMVARKSYDWESEASALSASEPDSDYVAIDKYVNVSGSAGPGTEVHEEAIVKVRVDMRLLRERIGNNFGKIKIASVSGDSMEPTLSHGDQVLVDTSCSRFIDDAIYAIQQDGHLRFKRIQLKLDGSIVVKSDGSSNIETYSAEEAQRFFVVGMVIPFKFGRFKI
jgi:phage repressor protein C with HTH and peptisase S24 domain